MNKLIIPALLAGAALVAVPQAAFAKKKDEAAPAAAQSIKGIAVANLEGVLQSAAANRLAAQQRPVTYKPQLDAREARRAQIEAQLKPLYEKIQKDSQAPSAQTPAGQAALQKQAATIQQIEQAGEQELNQIIMPIAYSEAYVDEQIQEKLDAAVKAVMSAKGVSILLKPASVYVVTDQTLNITNDILAEIDRVIPNAQLVPPQGWEPRQIREARAAQAAQQQAAAGAGAAPAQPAGPQIDGR